MLQKNRDSILFDHNRDGIDRRGFLKCMAWAGSGALCVLEGGVLKSFGLEDPAHMDEGAVWIRGTLAPSTGPSVSIALAREVRLVLANFPEVTQVVSQVGRPDDGSDASGFEDLLFRRIFGRSVPKPGWEEGEGVGHRKRAMNPMQHGNLPRGISEPCEQSSSILQQLVKVAVLGLCRRGVQTVFPTCTSRSRQTFRSSRARTRSSMHSAAAVAHRGSQTLFAFSRRAPHLGALFGSPGGLPFFSHPTGDL